ncbi:MAG TPA: hypothetical protein VIG26_00150 [Methyloceanibacter sp.]|jgi:hypothetical protein
MKRLLICGLVGPTIGFLLAVLTAADLGVRLWDGTVLAVLFIYAFAAGFVATVLTNCVDGHLASRTSLSRRIMLMPAAGCFLSVVIRFAFLDHKLSIDTVMIFALYGMIVVAFCSALARKDVSWSLK